MPNLLKALINLSISKNNKEGRKVLTQVPNAETDPKIR